MNSGEDDLVFSLVRNKGYKTLSSIFADEDQRDLADDTLTVVEGFVGVYPNFFLDVAADELDAMANDFLAVATLADYERFVLRYGVRRTNPNFWALADWFRDRYFAAEPQEAGILDLNRYSNL